MAGPMDEMLELEEDTQKDMFLTFKISQEAYGIAIKCVTEIISLQAITPVPEMPEYIKGIINLRGKIIPVMDVRLRFKKEAQEYTDRTCVIVTDIQGMAVGLIIDSVSDVLTIPETDIVPPPQVGKDCKQRFLKGIGKVGSDVKLILDCERLLNQEELDGLASC